MGLEEKIRKGIMTLNIEECPRCKGKHENVEVKPFERFQPKEATGWGICPALDEPFFVKFELTSSRETGS